MATLRTHLGMLATVGFALVGCNKLVGFSAPVTPLARIQLQVNGDLASVATPPAATGDVPHLRAALVWGLQWLTEPFCVLPPESAAVAAVQAAGCPDSFRFVPARSGVDVPVPPTGIATLELIDLPGADVMVGDITVTSRVAYASLIVYDDRNNNGAFDLRNPPHRHRHGQPPPAEDGGVAGLRDIVYAASFVSMTLPDQRVAFLEGTFDPTVAFYPRKGCPPPFPGFSLLSAGGFSAADALASAQTGQLPSEDPASCANTRLDPTPEVVLTLTSPTPSLEDLVCTANDGGGTSYYIEAPANSPDFTRTWACASFPNLGGGDAGVATGQQLVMAGAPTDACPNLVHYTLRGCDNDPACSAPSWDITSNPPTWWPCAASP